jgi:hypothetical protein
VTFAKSDPFDSLGSCDNVSRAKFEERKPNKMQQLDVYYYFLSQHVTGIIMPIFSRTNALLLHLVYIGLVLLDVFGSGCGALSCRK